MSLYFLDPLWIGYNLKTPQYELVNPSLGGRIGIPIEINLSDGENYYFTTGIHVKYENTVLSLPEKYTILNGDVSLLANRYYSNFYITLPTAIKLKASISRNNVLGLNVGLYHSLFLSGKTYDKFELGNLETDYSITTNKKENKYSAMFKESLFAGFGYEYKIKPNLRTYIYANYVLTFSNFFSPNAVNRVNSKENTLFHME